jgi:DNA replication and repair protein RecF
MYVERLSLTDFRSWTQVDLQLGPGATVLVGPNGQGKTNLVEAVGYAATLSSHRVASDAALIRAGAGCAVVRIGAVRGDRRSLVEVQINSGRANRAQINRSPVRRVRDVLGVVRTVVFAPEDLALVKGDPDGRRRFLDELAVQVWPKASGVLADYERVLKQRGALLKSASSMRRGSRELDLSTLDVWDARLAQLGTRVLMFRLALVEALRPRVATAYSQLSDGPADAVIEYRSSLGGATGDPADVAPAHRSAPEPTEELFLEAIGRARTRELDRGVNLVGPHRDDLMLSIGGLPAKGYASHGESWSLALALRLACFELLTSGDATRTTTGDVLSGIAGWDEGSEPVLVLDDVFAELDKRRRSRLASIVGRAEQVLLTAAVLEDVPDELVGVRLDVMDGRVRRGE